MKYKNRETHRNASICPTFLCYADLLGCTLRGRTSVFGVFWNRGPRSVVSQTAGRYCRRWERTRRAKINKNRNNNKNPNGNKKTAEYKNRETDDKNENRRKGKAYYRVLILLFLFSSNAGRDGRACSYCLYSRGWAGGGYRTKRAVGRRRRRQRRPDDDDDDGDDNGDDNDDDDERTHGLARVETESARRFFLPSLCSCPPGARNGRREGTRPPGPMDRQLGVAAPRQPEAGRLARHHSAAAAINLPNRRRLRRPLFISGVSLAQPPPPENDFGTLPIYTNNLLSTSLTAAPVAYDPPNDRWPSRLTFEQNSRVILNIESNPT